MMPVFVGHELSHGHPSMSLSANCGDFHQTWGPHMTTDLYSRITQQQQLLDQLRADAPDIAATLADEVWDRFEVEIEEVTEYGIDFDFAQSIAISLSLSLAQAYERAFEHHVLERCERLSASLAQAMEQQTIDTARINLTGMRKKTQTSPSCTRTDRTSHRTRQTERWQNAQYGSGRHLPRLARRFGCDWK